MNDNTIYFNSGIPSNFYIAPFFLPMPITIDFGCREREFKGVEWWFQAYKVVLCDEPTREMYEEIADADSASEAKHLGKQVPLDDDAIRYWNGFLSAVVMLEGNLAKFWQNNDCAEWLRNTGTKRLVEHRPDKVWGDGMDGSGQNRLGHTLELVRATIT